MIGKMTVQPYIGALQDGTAAKMSIQFDSYNFEEVLKCRIHQI